MALAAIPFGLAIGMSVGMIGGGGSILTMPVLVYVLGQGVHEATTESLVVVTAAALAGGVRHARGGRVCWRHAAAFTAAALPGVIAGTGAGEAVGGNALLAAFGLIMLVAGGATWRKSGAMGAADEGEGQPGCPPVRLERDLGAGLVIGFLTGFFGVGGGFLIVPTLAIFLALSMRAAVGTSLVIITITSAMGLGVHLLAGRELELDVTASMTAACVAGAIVGATAAGHVPQERLGRGFTAVVIGVAAYLLVSAVFLGGPPAP